MSNKEDDGVVAAVARTIENDPQDGWSLPAWVYSDPDYFAAEMARVIRPSWQVV
jgi:hypothetical protein